MQRAGLAFAVLLAALTPTFAAARRSHRGCLTAAQARQEIARHKLAHPFRLMIDVARRFKAEALGAKLCRRKGGFVYEISLLRRDGRVIHVFLNAVNGRVIRVINAK